MAKQNEQKLRNDEIVNYLFRPAKNIERKMLCEALSRLSVISDIKNYQYVGFGSVYFADFILFHKNLGIQKLISIEGEEDMEPRVRFNRPFSCIEVLSGFSTDMLPEVNWSENRSILWVDYTESLKGYMFKDMATFFQRALSGSVFVISVNVDIKETEVGIKTVSQKIKSKIDKDVDVRKRISSKDYNKELTRSDYYSLVRNIINNEIIEVLRERNKLEDEEKYHYKQIFNILYQDGQAMLTVGGILYSESESDRFKQLNFENLEFIMPDNDFFEIKVPNLTAREIHAIDKHLPNFSINQEAKDKALAELNGIVSEEAITIYSTIYRYYPKFTESNS